MSFNNGRDWSRLGGGVCETNQGTLLTLHDATLLPYSTYLSKRFSSLRTQPHNKGKTL